MDIPQRLTLASQAVEVIKKMIEAGELENFLPGERSLAQTLQIGRDTLRAALKELEKQRWISIGEHGKKRKILAKIAAENKKKKRTSIGFVSPKKLEELPPRMLVEIDTLREMLAQRDIDFQVVTPGVFHLKRPETRLEEMVSQSQYDAWILYQCPEPIQRWFSEQKVLCLVRGSVYPGVKFPSLDVDWGAAGVHAANMLISQGHSSIGLLVPDTELQGLLATEDGVKSALAKVDGSTLHVIKESRTVESITIAMQKALRKDAPPTAIITTRSRQVLTLLSWLAFHGVRIPRDISVVSLDYDQLYEALVPKMCYFNVIIKTDF